MPTPDDFNFDGLDEARPLPPGLAERLEAALLAAAGAINAADADATLFASLDAPRPLTSEQEARMEGALMSAAPSGVSANPPVQGAESAHTSVFQRRSALLAVAAVIALILGSAAVLNRGGSDQDVTASAPEAPSTADEAEASPSAPSAGAFAPAVPEAAPAPAAPAPPAAAAPSAAPAAKRAAPAPQAASAPASAPAPTSAGAVPAKSPAAAGAPAPGAGASPGGAEREPARESTASGSPPPAFQPSGEGAPPPYAFGDSPPPSSAGSQAAPSPAPGPPSSDESGDRAKASPAIREATLRIGVVGGDTAQEAAFRAYVDAVNAAGGIDGRNLELVPVTPGQAAPGTIVTVNLSGRAVAGDGGERPAWVTGALLETLTATEAAQPAGGSVRSFASPPERQAQLVAADLFATDARGTTAVVFTSASEPWHTIVPAAVEAVLSPLGVSVERVAYDPDRPPALFPAADAAILSLDAAGVRSWVRHAKVTAYRPGRGIGGVSTLHDESLLPDLPEGTRFASPYAVPPGAEGEAIRSAAGPVSAAGLHGWATAKMLAVALWHTGADTPDEVTGALARLEGYDPGLFPPYQTRGSSNARVPDGLLYQVRSGAFAAQGGFRRDP